MGKLIFVVSLCALLWVSTGRAEGLVDVDWTVEPSDIDSGVISPMADEHCDRSLTYESVMSGGFLTADEKAAIEHGSLVMKSVRQGSGYDIGYVFGLAKYDPELVMGVFSSCNEHAGANGLGKFIQRSEVQAPPAGSPQNVFTVKYRQEGTWPFDGAEYRVENTLSAVAYGGGVAYSLDSRLIDASNASFSPKWADSYFRVYPHPAGSFSIACNYMVPRSGNFRSQYNDTARDRLGQTGRNLMSWVGRVAGDPAAATKKRDHLKLLLGVQ